MKTAAVPMIQYWVTADGDVAYGPYLVLSVARAQAVRMDKQPGRFQNIKIMKFVLSPHVFSE